MPQKIKKKLNTILTIFILIQPFLDILTALSLHIFHWRITVGILIRTLFLLFIMYITLFLYKKKKTLWYYSAIFIYIIVYLTTILLYKEEPHILGELQSLVRTFYFPLLLISLYSLKDEMRIENKIFAWTALEYILIIFVGVVFDFGFKSYEIAKGGTLGLLNSANEVGGIISILTPFLILFSLEKKNIILKFSLIVCYLVAILNIGTKAPILAFSFTAIWILAWIIKQMIKTRQFKKIAVILGMVIIVAVSIIMVLPQTSFYKNIKIHLEFLKVEKISDILGDSQLIDHFIFSQRLSFLDNRNKVYQKSNPIQKAIGIGYYNNEGQEEKLIEIDYFDIYYSHGYVGYILYFFIYIAILQEIIKAQKKWDFDHYIKWGSIVLLLILSLFTGHIITAPAVSLLASCILLSLNQGQKINKEP